MHKIDLVKDKIKEWKTKISMIPGGLKRYLQPLDVIISKSFKDKLKKRYTNYYFDQKDIKARIINLRRFDKLSWRDLVWW